jgi:starch phosphorylase
MRQPTVGYFSMEIGLRPDLPTYSGGLGALAGDTISAAADLGVPMTAVTLLYRKGYFSQRLDEHGRQHADPVEWNPSDVLTEMAARSNVEIEGRKVMLRAWKLEVTGSSGHVVPVYFLDADLPENADQDRRLTDHLYGGDDRYRLCQEVILGIGGVRMLKALGYDSIARYHMNEGHAALLTFQLLRDEATRHGRNNITREDFEVVHDRCIFTTHTPVPAGHDQFPIELVDRVIGIDSNSYVDFRDQVAGDMVEKILRTGAGRAEQIRDLVRPGVNLNMTYLALNLSRYVNGVAKKHGEVSRHMFSGYEIDAITNGVHCPTWASEAMQELFDRYIADWRRDSFSLRGAMSIPINELRSAHRNAKVMLLKEVQERTGVAMDPDSFTIGFARRAATYKRADLLFHDVERLKKIARDKGALQIVYAGKAHPKDVPGQESIRRIFEAARSLQGEIPVVYLANYDLAMARRLTAGADLWLNTPMPPNEASGTSGMKAALNGTPNLSVLDGWWIEGWIEGITGWAIGEPAEDPTQVQDPAVHAASLYDKLENVIVPLFYNDPNGFAHVMRHSIALNGAFFSTQRMVQEYVLKAYLPGGVTPVSR